MESFNDYIVDKKQLLNNVDNIKKLLNKRVKFCAVVKANAYGTGYEFVCDTLKDKVDFFAVACLKEAMEIRKLGINTNILILGIVDKKYYQLCADNNISISISSLSMLENVELSSKNPLKIHIKTNTGMNRFGVRSYSEFKKILKYIECNSSFKLEGVFTHLATKSEDKCFIRKQLYKYIQFKKIVENKKFKHENIIFHLANSYAIIYEKSLQMDMVRSGFLMYGGMKNNINNKCIVSIKSKIINITNVKRGDSISYDRTYIVNCNMRVGVVGIGYADGFDRRLSNNFSVLIGGKECKILGNICMDVFMVDITNTDAKLGDEVVILGKQKSKTISLDDYASVLNTSPYEILLKFNSYRMNYVIK